MLRNGNISSWLAQCLVRKSPIVLKDILHISVSLCSIRMRASMKYKRTRVERCRRHETMVNCSPLTINGRRSTRGAINWQGMQHSHRGNGSRLTVRGERPGLFARAIARVKYSASLFECCRKPPSVHYSAGDSYYGTMHRSQVELGTCLPALGFELSGPVSRLNALPACTF